MAAPYSTGSPELLLDVRLRAVAATLLIYATFIVIRLVTGRVVNRERVDRLTQTVKEWEDRRRKAIEAKDMKAYEKVMREKSRVERIRSELNKEKLKASLVTVTLWLIVFRAAGMVIDPGEPVIKIPFVNNEYLDAPFYVWFILNSLWAGTLVNRVLQPVFKS